MTRSIHSKVLASIAVMVLVEVIVLLAVSVVLSSYERRVMALVHNRDAPIVYMVSGMGQPIADGGKLTMKSTRGIHTQGEGQRHSMSMTAQRITACGE